MSMTSKQPAFPITAAGEKYLELYAQPVVTSSYLKAALLALSLVCLALLLLFYRAQTAALHLKPLIISVSDAGRGQVMQYDDFEKVPLDRVSKYYLARWATLYYARNHATLQRDFSESLNFFSDPLENAAISETRKARTLEAFLAAPAHPTINIEIRAVTLEDLRQAPYPAHIEFEKGFPFPRDPQQPPRARWTP